MNGYTPFSLLGGGHIKTGTFCENGSSLACASDDGLIALIKLRVSHVMPSLICNNTQD